MDDALKELFERLPKDVSVRLDYSPESLAVFEAWLLDQYAGPQALMQPAASRVLDGAARYIGETFRKTAGGHWTIDLEDRDNALLPVQRHLLLQRPLVRRPGAYSRRGALPQSRQRVPGCG